MMFKRILCATDFSPGAERAVAVATRLAREVDAELFIAHVWFVPAAMYTLEVPHPPELIQQIIDDAQLGLEHAVTAARAAGAERVSGILRRGPAWVQLVEELETSPYDVCVVGTQGESRLARVLLGSVAEKVVRHAPCPVLAVRPDATVAPFQHVLVPTDFSDSSTRALDVAAMLVASAGRITLLHVIDAAPECPVPEFPRRLQQRATADLVRQAALVSPIAAPVQLEMRFGAPGPELLSVIDSDPTIDLVVTGSHGRTGLKRVLMGSVAEKLVRHARCSVAVAHLEATSAETLRAA